MERVLMYYGLKFATRWWHDWLSYIEGFSQRIDDFVSKYFFDHIFQYWSVSHWQILTVSLNLEHVTSPVSWACLEKRMLLYVSIYIFWHFFVVFLYKICVFIIFIYLFDEIKFPQQIIIDKKLSMKLYVGRVI